MFVSPEIAGEPRRTATMRMYIEKPLKSKIEICMPRNRFIDAFPSNGITLNDPETRKG